MDPLSSLGMNSNLIIVLVSFVDFTQSSLQPLKYKDS